MCIDFLLKSDFTLAMNNIIRLMAIVWPDCSRCYLLRMGYTRQGGYNFCTFLVQLVDDFCYLIRLSLRAVQHMTVYCTVFFFDDYKSTHVYESVLSFYTRHSYFHKKNENCATPCYSNIRVHQTIDGSDV